MEAGIQAVRDVATGIDKDQLRTRVSLPSKNQVRGIDEIILLGLSVAVAMTDRDAPEESKKYIFVTLQFRRHFKNFLPIPHDPVAALHDPVLNFWSFQMTETGEKVWFKYTTIYEVPRNHPGDQDLVHIPDWPTSMPTRRKARTALIDFFRPLASGPEQNPVEFENIGPG